MKVAVIGGSALSTPALWSYLINEARLEDLRMTLAGRDRGRLQAVWRAGSMVAEAATTRLQLTLLDSPATWDRLADTDLFLIQIRVGGYSARSVDETFPVRYGVCGDEGLGPGGLSAGIRNWQAIRRVLERIEKLETNPLVVMLSSPVGLLVRSANQTFPHMKVAGICELPWTTLLDICRTVGVDRGGVCYDYFGLNHLAWFHRLAVGDRDILREYASLRKRDASFPTGALIESCGGVPLKYLRLHYEREKVLGEQHRQRQTRAEQVGQISENAFRIYREGDRSEIETALASRPSPWYRYAVGPLIASLAGGIQRAPLFLSVRNAGSDSQFRDDDVLEFPHVVDGGRLRRLSQSNVVPAHMRELTQRFVAYERLASAALRSGTAQDVENAIRKHPWMDGVQRSEEMARQIVKHSRLVAA